jgi:hypothetical protein
MLRQSELVGSGTSPELTIFETSDQSSRALTQRSSIPTENWNLFEVEETQAACKQN